MSSKADEIRSSLNPATDAAAAHAAQVAQLQDQLQAAMQQIANLVAQMPKPAEPEAPPSAKRYYSQAPFCTFHVMRGPGHCEPVNFIAGSLETSDPQVQAALNQVVDRPGSGIYSKSNDEVSAEVSAMQDDVRNSAIIARDKALKAGLSV